MHIKRNKIVFFGRKPRKDGNFSIERVFSDLAKKLQDDFFVEYRISKFYTKGFFRRIYNALEAILFQGEINHITGDIHYVALLMNKKKTVITMHDCVILERSSGIKKLIYLFFWYRLPFWRARIVTTPSEFSKKELLKYLKCEEAKIQVIRNPLSPIFVESRKQFNSRCPNILMIGTSENKNIIRSVNALKGLNCRVTIIGALTEQLTSCFNSVGIKYCNKARLTDEEIYCEYVESDILLFPSTYEGFGLPIIEAQAVGRVVVTSNISPMVEVANNSACLVNPYSTSSIRRGILNVIENSSYREELIEAGLFNADNYSLCEISNLYSNLYREILSN